MKFASFAMLSLGSLLVAGLLAAASQEKKPADKPDRKETPKTDSALVNSETAKYVDVGVPGVSRAIISGDPEKGAYRAFTKFAPGTSHAMHTHPNDIWVVVIKGAYIQKSESGEETRVGPGCAFHVAAGVKHASSSDPKDGLIMLEESNEKFGLEFVDKDKKK